MKKVHYVLIGGLAGLVVGIFVIHNPAKEVPPTPTKGATITIKPSTSNSTSKNPQPAGSDVLNNSIMNIQQGSSGKNIQSAPTSIDQIIGNSNIQVK